MSIKVGLIVADRRSVRLCIERGTDHGIDADRIRYFDVEVCYPSMDAAVLRRFDGVFSIVDEAGRYAGSGCLPAARRRKVPRSPRS